MRPPKRTPAFHLRPTRPPRQRAAIVLRFYEDLSERESADILGCSVGALNQLVVRATATLRDRFGKDER